MFGINRRSSKTPPPRARVAVLCSMRAPGLEDLLEAAADGGDFEIALLLTSDENCESIEMALGMDVFTVVHDIRAWHRARGLRWSDLAHRPAYDAQTADLLKESRIDYVVTLGYLHVLTAPMLDAFDGRIVNVHDADLDVRDLRGVPRYRGLRATRDALLDGQRETRSTAHLVTADLDGGPVLVRSWDYPVHVLVQDALAMAADDILKAYAFAHREWMMRTSWGRLALVALDYLTRGRVQVFGDAAVVDGTFGGVTLGSPSSPDAILPPLFGAPPRLTVVQ